MAHRIDDTANPIVPSPGDSERGFTHARFSPPAKARLPSPPVFEEQLASRARREAVTRTLRDEQARVERELSEADAALARLNSSTVAKSVAAAAVVSPALRATPSSVSPAAGSPAGKSSREPSPVKVFIYEGFSSAEVHRQHPHATPVEKAETLVYEAIEIAKGSDPAVVERSFESARLAEQREASLGLGQGSPSRFTGPASPAPGGSVYGGSAYGGSSPMGGIPVQYGSGYGGSAYGGSGYGAPAPFGGAFNGGMPFSG